MLRNQIEAWALQVIDRVERGQPTEDAFVELKSVWVESDKTARQIAAHANAARGQPILWLIGVDEKLGVKGVPAENLANWWQQVRKHFEGHVAPDLTDFNIYYDEKRTVVALYLLADRAPYVIKKGEMLEVPWREGTSTGSATRVQLLRLLAPLQKLPEIEILSANFKQHVIDGPYVPFSSWVNMYIAAPGQQRVYLPHHKCRLTVRVGDEQYDMGEISLSVKVHVEDPFCTVADKPDHLIVTGAGGASMYGSARREHFGNRVEVYTGPVEVRVDLGTAGSDRTSTATTMLHYTEQTPRWWLWGDKKGK